MCVFAGQKHGQCIGQPIGVAGGGGNVLGRPQHVSGAVSHGHSQPGRIQQGKVVAAVAGGQRLFGLQAQLPGQQPQRGALVHPGGVHLQIVGHSLYDLNAFDCAQGGAGALQLGHVGKKEAEFLGLAGMLRQIGSNVGHHSMDGVGPLAVLRTYTLVFQFQIGPGHKVTSVDKAVGLAGKIADAGVHRLCPIVRQGMQGQNFGRERLGTAVPAGAGRRKCIFAQIGHQGAVGADHIPHPRQSQQVFGQIADRPPGGRHDGNALCSGLPQQLFGTRADGLVALQQGTVQIQRQQPGLRWVQHKTLYGKGHAIVVVVGSNVVGGGLYLGHGVAHGHTQPGSGQHGGIVAAVAAGHHLVGGNAQQLPQCQQPIPLIHPGGIYLQIVRQAGRCRKAQRGHCLNGLLPLGFVAEEHGQLFHPVGLAGNEGAHLRHQQPCPQIGQQMGVSQFFVQSKAVGCGVGVAIAEGINAAVELPQKVIGLQRLFGGNIPLHNGLPGVQVQHPGPVAGKGIAHPRQGQKFGRNAADGAPGGGQHNHPAAQRLGQGGSGARAQLFLVVQRGAV